MGPNFDVSAAPSTLVTEFSNKLESLNIIKLVVVGELVFVSRVFVLLIMERCLSLRN